MEVARAACSRPAESPGKGQKINNENEIQYCNRILQHICMCVFRVFSRTNRIGVLIITIDLFICGISNYDDELLV